MSISTTETQLGYRHHGRGGPAGLLVTLIVHGVIGYVVYQAQRNSPPPAVQVRDLLVTKMVTIGKPREKFWLPRIVTPPPPAPPPEAVIKVASADAAPAPPPEPTPPPKVAETPPEKPAERPSRTDSRSTSSDLKRALIFENHP